MNSYFNLLGYIFYLKERLLIEMSERDGERSIQYTIEEGGAGGGGKGRYEKKDGGNTQKNFKKYSPLLR